MSYFSRFAPALLAATIVTGGTTTRPRDEQHFPLQSYRVGPYAAGGTGFFRRIHRLPEPHQHPRRRG